MSEGDRKSRPIYENLDTAYVNLAALLRYLRGREFVGRVHVLLDEYEAEVFLAGKGEPRVREVDHAADREAEGEAALQRLLVRSSEPGGRIGVYESADEEQGEAMPSAELETEATGGEPQEIAWPELLRLSGELIAAVERATLSFGADFAAVFRAARLELADDFSFLDPATERFQYAHGVARLRSEPRLDAYISGISETLRRVVDRLARAERGGGVRERVALELAVLARRREAALRHLKLLPHLDRIAGTKVL